MIRWLLLTISSWAVELVGLIVVLLALPFRRTIDGTRQKFTQYVGWWELVRLPTWALWWDNAYDGLLGDRRGWWNRTVGDCRTIWAMYRWAAIRNPANYFSRNIAGVDVTTLKIALAAGSAEVIEEPGQRNWQLIRALRDDGAYFFRLFGVFAYPFRPDKGLMFDFGWKLKLSHRDIAQAAPEKDRFKGLVCTLSLWKGL